MKVFTINVILVFFEFFNLYGQVISRQVIASAGESISNATYQLDFTIGEPMVTTIQNGSFILNQGFQQSDQFVITGIESENKILDCFLYPNPTSGKTSLRINSYESLNLTIRIWNIKGQNMSNTIQSHPTQVENQVNLDLTYLPAGLYLLQIFNNKQELLKQFKLVKD